MLPMEADDRAAALASVLLLLLCATLLLLLALKVAELLLEVSEPKRPAREMKVAELFDRFSAGKKRRISLGPTNAHCVELL